MSKEKKKAETDVTDAAPVVIEAVGDAVADDSQAVKIAMLEAEVTGLRHDLAVSSTYATKLDDECTQLKQKLVKQAAEFEKDWLEAEATGPALPDGDAVYLDGEWHDVVGTFRADANFDQVKRRHCEEGCTLVAIAKKH